MPDVLLANQHQARKGRGASYTVHGTTAVTHDKFKPVALLTRFPRAKSSTLEAQKMDSDVAKYQRGYQGRNRQLMTSEWKHIYIQGPWGPDTDGWDTLALRGQLAAMCLAAFVSKCPC